MKLTSSALAVFALLISLSGCGGSVPTEAEFVEEMKDFGYSDSLTDCMMTEIKDSSGSVEEFFELSNAEQESRAFDAGRECGQTADPAEFDGVIDLSDPSLRAPLIDGLTSQGMPAEVANCIVDEAIAQDLQPSDFSDDATMSPIFESCAG